MTFNSIPFIILFPVAVFLYYIVPKRFRYVWLLVCSYAFYYMCAKGFVALIAATTVIIYIAGHAIAVTDHKGGKKAILAVAAVICLGILFVFKYLDFSLSLFGSGLRFNLMLPVGISFYTFQAVSYIADVYREKIEPEKNIFKLALYLSFFLSILSGPINRAHDMLPQFEEPDDLSTDQIKRGMQKMLWGYFLKLAIAGRLAIVVDNVYGASESYSGASVALTALFYMFMLYCDFEGYSQIAIGAGYILGIKMKENFRQPFFSESLSEMWRRWHVSLSTWFRDYMYIPLGGNRKGTVRKYINLFVVLFVSGIWHGANLTFFAWGAINGIFLIAGQLLMPYRDRVAGGLKEKICKNDKSEKTFDSIREALKRIGTYILFSYSFIYFANDSMTNAYLAVKRILTGFFDGTCGELFLLGLGRFNLALTLAMILFVLIADGNAYRRDCDTPDLITRIPTVARWIIYYALLTAILFSANLSGKEFIYSRM